MSQLHTKSQPANADHNNPRPQLIFETATDYIIWSCKKHLGIDLSSPQNSIDSNNEKSNHTYQNISTNAQEEKTIDNNHNLPLISNENSNHSNDSPNNTTNAEENDLNTNDNNDNLLITPIENGKIDINNDFPLILDQNSIHSNDTPNNATNAEDKEQIENNPYLDMQLMKGFEQFSPESNKQFEQKYKKHNQKSDTKIDQNIDDKINEFDEKIDTTIDENDNEIHKCVGILKCFYNEKQYGFITYESKDLFFHESDFNNITPNEITNIINQSVSFTIESYIDKKTQTMKQKAININVITNNINNNQSIGIHKGKFLFFNKHKRFGFIECETNKNITTLFVYESELHFDSELIYKGMRLQFDIETYYNNIGETKRKAVNVSIDILAENKKHNLKAGIYTGTLLWFDTNKKFGFIKCENNTGLFVHESELKFDANLICEGMSLTFDIELDSVQFDNFGHHKRKAVNVNINYENENTNLEKKRGSHSGVLLWFDRDKKFGFIESDRDNIGVFVHDSELKFDRRLIHEGMVLTFDIKLDEVQLDNKGEYKKKAVNVDIDDDYIDF